MFRGGDAASMKDEFAVYGLPIWSVYVVGGLKIIGATLLLLGIAYPVMVAPSALIICTLMVGAVAMHLKIRDTPLKTAPSLLVLSSSFLILVSSLPTG